MSVDWGSSASADPFEDLGPIRKVPKLFPIASLVSAGIGFVLAILHSHFFGFFRGFGLILGITGYLLCLIVPVVAFLLLEMQKLRMQKEYRSRFDAYDALRVTNLQRKASVLGVVLSLLPIWYVAGAIGEWFK